MISNKLGVGKCDNQDVEILTSWLLERLPENEAKPFKDAIRIYLTSKQVSAHYDAAIKLKHAT